MKVNKKLIDMKRSLKCLKLLGDDQFQKGVEIFSKVKYLPKFLVSDQLDLYIGEQVGEYMRNGGDLYDFIRMRRPSPEERQEMLSMSLVDYLKKKCPEAMGYGEAFQAARQRS